MPIASYRDLRVWQLSMDLVAAVYHLTAKLPADERFGLTSQMRRSAISIPSNIAEGSRRSRRDYAKHVTYSYGSGAELETQLELVIRLGFGTNDDVANTRTLLEEVMKMLNGLRVSLADEEPALDVLRTTHNVL